MAMNLPSGGDEDDVLVEMNTTPLIDVNNAGPQLKKY